MRRNIMISESTSLSFLGAGVHTYPCAKYRMGYYTENNTGRETYVKRAYYADHKYQKIV